MHELRRRDLLASSAILLFGASGVRAGILQGAVPWQPAAGTPPKQVTPGPWHFFTPAEGRAMEAIVDRLIPPDPDTPGGKDAGVAVFIDRQLAGPFGRAEGHYEQAPFQHGTKEQGAQSSLTPTSQYRRALAAIETYAKSNHAGREFVDLADDDKDKVLTALEHGDVKIEGFDGVAFFTALIKNTREGFFGDPIYGGNRDMAGWKMIGFPGARYDYSDWIDRHNERYPHPPIGLTGAPNWSPR